MQKALILLVEDPGFWKSLFPSIVASIILIVLFVLGRFLDSIIERKKDKKTWYLSVIINPNINKLYSFYSRTFKRIKSSYHYLGKHKHVDEKKIVELKSIEISKFQQIKREFEFEFISLVYSNYPEIADSLTEIISLLEDECTTFLDSFDTSDLNEIEEKISQSKSNLIRELYRPLEFKKFSIWFKRNYLWVSVVLLLVILTMIYFQQSKRKNINNSNNPNKDSIQIDSPAINKKGMSSNVVDSTNIKCNPP